MTRTPVELVPPIDGLDLLVDGRDFLLVRVQDLQGERIRVGIGDATVRLLLIVRPRASRARLVLTVLAVMLGVAVVMLGATSLGFSPMLVLSMAIAVAGVGMFFIVLSQPPREYRFHDDMPGGLERPPLLVMAERAGQRRWFALRDEQGRTFGDIGHRLGRWRVRGYEPIDPTEHPGSPMHASDRYTSTASRLDAWGHVVREGEPTPRGRAPELTLSIVRHSMSWASLLGGLISGPVGIVLSAHHRPWKRMEFRRGGVVVATGHRLDDGSAMRLEVAPTFEVPGPEGAWIDRRHLLALAAMGLSFEAER